MSKDWAKGSDYRWRKFRLTILERDKWLCKIKSRVCTIKAEHVHHIVPLSKGGDKYDTDNCQSACRACNLHTGARGASAQPSPQPTTVW